MDFSKVSTGDSDIPSSCEMKDEPTFKALQGSRTSFESGHIGVHSTWGRKHRVALIYLFLREGFSWGACGELAYLFSGRQGVILILRSMGCKEVSSSFSTVIDDPLYLRRFSQGISRVSQRESSQLFCMMWIMGWLWSQWKGNWPLLNLIWRTPSYSEFLSWHQCSSCPVTVLLGTLWSSIKQFEAPFEFDWENAIALHVMQGNRAPSCGEWEVSWVFSSCGRNVCYILELGRGCPSETGVCSVKSEHLSRYVDTSGS